jgi:hypothetical protein
VQSDSNFKATVYSKIRVMLEIRVIMNNSKTHLGSDVHACVPTYSYLYPNPAYSRPIPYPTPSPPSVGFSFRFSFTSCEPARPEGSTWPRPRRRAPRSIPNAGASERVTSHPIPEPIDTYLKQKLTWDRGVLGSVRSLQRRRSARRKARRAERGSQVRCDARRA